MSQLAERVKAQRVKEVKEQMSWEVERSCIALQKLQDWYSTHTHAHTMGCPLSSACVLFLRFRDFLSPVVTVGGSRTNHRVSTFHMPALIDPSLQLSGDSSPGPPDEDDKDEAAAAPEYEKTKMELADDSAEMEGVYFSPHLTLRSPNVQFTVNSDI